LNRMTGEISLKGIFLDSY